MISQIDDPQELLLGVWISLRAVNMRLASPERVDDRAREAIAHTIAGSLVALDKFHHLYQVRLSGSPAAT